ncbi:MAG: hypothetical protein IH611_04180 [Deltaproteobacteria bacterium]|nr:hypothetical protein [Deltaproteobacteria bacterium]
MRKGLAVAFVLLMVSFAAGCGGESGTTADTPSNLEATNYLGYVILDWDSSDNAESYIVYRSTSSGDVSSKTIWASSLTATAFMDISASSGTTYYYQVTAVDSDGDESAGSTEVGIAAE